jgi:TatD DNase family protein
MEKAIRHIDIHGHVNFPEYDSDRGDVIKRAEEAGVGMISVGTDIASSRCAIDLAETHKNMWAAIGIHPTEIIERRNSIKPETKGLKDQGVEAGTSFEGAPQATDEDSSGCSPENSRTPRKIAPAGMDDKDEFQQLRRLSIHPKVVAIGECGLDYFQVKEHDIPAQIEAFERHIAIANEARKPLMLHVRNGKKKGDRGSVASDAYEDALDILKKSSKVPFNFHFFAGTVENMKNIIEAGGTVSFTGVITFTHDYDELIKQAPLGSIMSETDCPYVSPVPHRGKRNEPAYVIEAVKAIARIRGEDEEKVRVILLENARRMFSLPS